ncbi:acetolactate synthase small subunit [bacterium]|nr:acetolactate synthase small subunit [bacterium]
MSDIKPIISRDNIHTISLLVANKPGVLLRISLIFSRRGFNIESLVVSPTLDGRFSRMTITAQGNPAVLDQIIKQAAKLVDVVHATEHKDQSAVQKELALIKVKMTPENRAELLQAIHHFKAQTVDLNSGSVIIQVTGSTEKLDAMMDFLTSYGIIEVVRTGKIVMARGTEKT